MAKLINIPNEILEYIFTYVADLDHSDIFKIRLVNKHFSQIAAPLRVHHWTDHGHYERPSSSPAIDRFALELLRYPELRPRVKSLDINTFQDPKDHGDGHALVDAENLGLLAKVARELLPDLASSTNLCEGIRHGQNGAIAVLVLAWSTNLTKLGLTISHFERENDYRLLVLCFAKQLALRFVSDDSKPTEPLPLEKLNHLNFRHWDTEGAICMKYLSPFLYFPNLKILEAYRIGDDYEDDPDGVMTFTENSYMMPYRKRTSPLESLFLEETNLSNIGLERILSVCRNLKVFHVYFSEEEATRSSTDFARSIVKHAPTLEEIVLLLDYDAVNWVSEPGEADALIECFRKLKKLKRASIEMDHLFQSEDGSETTSKPRKMKPSRLPQSIEYLMLFDQSLWCTWKRLEIDRGPAPASMLNQFVSDRRQVLIGMLTLLEETGPKGRLKNLKTIDCSDALYDDPKLKEVKMVKELAEVRGVKFIFRKLDLPFAVILT